MREPGPAVQASGSGASPRYWFAMSDRPGYLDSYVPVTSEGQLIFALMCAGIGAGCIALVVIGQIYREPIWGGIATVALIAGSVGTYAIVSRRMGDPRFMKADYVAGRVPVRSGGANG